MTTFVALALFAVAIAALMIALESWRAHEAAEANRRYDEREAAAMRAAEEKRLHDGMRVAFDRLYDRAERRARQLQAVEEARRRNRERAK